MSSPILGNVVFDLTFLNDVSRKHETIKDIHAQVLDSCIAIILGRPIIRENHLVRKIPLYFDEIPSSKPDLSQPVEPVTTPVIEGLLCEVSYQSRIVINLLTSRKPRIKPTIFYNIKL